MRIDFQLPLDEFTSDERAFVARRFGASYLVAACGCVSLLLFGSVFAGLQIWWISALMVRNRRRMGERPLSSQQFRRDLERIFREET